MPSYIDDGEPKGVGSPPEVNSQKVRDNFAAAKSEIEALQSGGATGPQRPSGPPFQAGVYAGIIAWPGGNGATGGPVGPHPYGTMWINTSFPVGTGDNIRIGVWTGTGWPNSLPGQTASTNWARCQ